MLYINQHYFFFNRGMTAKWAPAKQEHLCTNTAKFNHIKEIFATNFCVKLVSLARGYTEHIAVSRQESPHVIKRAGSHLQLCYDAATPSLNN